MGMLAKIVVTAALFALPISASAQETKSFKLSVGQQELEINPGDTLDLTLPDGSKTKVTLTRNEFAAYSAAKFSFLHPSAFSVTKSDLGQGITQHLLASAVGTIVIVQEYETLDPSTLIQLMLQEMTKESVAGGATITQAPATRKTPAGKTLTGITATEAGKSDTAGYEIFGYGNDGSGLLVITRLDRANKQQDTPMIEKFWESFEVK